VLSRRADLREADFESFREKYEKSGREVLSAGTVQEDFCHQAPEWKKKLTLFAVLQ
jgi:hypothetical protein